MLVHSQAGVSPLMSMRLGKFSFSFTFFTYSFSYFTCLFCLLVRTWPTYLILRAIGKAFDMITCFLSLLFLDMCLSPHVVQKSLYKKISVGETHRDHETKFDRENHEIGKIINQRPHTPKWALRGHHRVPPSHPTTSPPCVAFRPMSGLSQIENHMLRHLKRDRKGYFIHDLGINSHNTFPKSLATIRNLF
jgi:hypothetical protein